MSWAQSAGALYSNVDDLSKWLDMYDGDRIVSNESIKDMQTPYLGSYGLGVWIKPFGGDFEIGHSGRTPGFVSNVSYLKNSKLKVITLDNVDGAFRIKDLLLGFYTTGSVNAVKLSPYGVSADKLKEYVGKYVLQNFLVQIYLKNGKLYLQTNDEQPPYELIANDLDSFQIQGIIGEEFVRNEKNEIAFLKHYQNGKVSTFVKISEDLLKLKSRSDFRKMPKLFNLNSFDEKSIFMNE